MSATPEEVTPTQGTDNSSIDMGVVYTTRDGVLVPTGCRSSSGAIRQFPPARRAGFSLYETHHATEASLHFNIEYLADLVKNPRVGPKETAPLIVPFHGDGKTGKHAREALFYALVVDLDDANWSKSQINKTFAGMKMVAFTTSSSTADDRKWKVVIPYGKPIGYELHVRIAEGVCAAVGADPAQARKQQGFYAPNKLAEESDYDCIVILGKCENRWLDPEGGSKFIQNALAGWEQLEAERLAKQQKAAPKPRDAESLGVIGKINAAYDLRMLLEEHGYIEVGGKWLPAYSSSPPGVYLLTGDDGVERLFSHHGEKDPLSALNHGGHSLDVADVLCALKYGGDFGRMIATEAVILDEVGNKERQREHMREKDRARLDPSLTDGYDLRPPDMSLDEMLTDLVYVSEGDQISSLSDPSLSVHARSAQNHFACCKTTIGEDTGTPKQVKTIGLWMGSVGRKSVRARTFKAGAGPICRDPNGRTALNSWRDFDYDESLIGADISPFINHVYYLFGDKADMFLDWSAHAIQKPGELPHFGIVHISAATGKGRSILGGFFTKGVFRGYGITGVDLSGMLKKGFNSIIAGKVFATVDEIKTGSKYDDKEAMKSLINAEIRIVDGKHEKPYAEFNACRWLIFSNHLDAVAIDETDRRFWFVEHTEAGKPLEYYTELVAWCNDYRNAEAVRVWLKHRDISKFNPGERPPLDEAKLNAIAANKSADAYIVEDIINDWGSDVIGTDDVRKAAMFRDHKFSSDKSMGYALKEAKCQQANPVKVDKKTERIYTIRDHDKWANAEPHERVAELLRGREPRTS